MLRFSYLPSKMKGRKGSVYIYFSIRLFQVFWDLPSYTITHLLDKNKILGRETQKKQTIMKKKQGAAVFDDYFLKKERKKRNKKIFQMFS